MVGPVVDLDEREESEGPVKEVSRIVVLKSAFQISSQSEALNFFIEADCFMTPLAALYQ